MLHISHSPTLSIEVDSVTVLRRFSENKIATNFHDIPTYFVFNVISIGKYPKLFLHFFRRNFDGQKFHVVSSYFDQNNIDRQKTNVTLLYFFHSSFNV